MGNYVLDFYEFTITQHNFTDYIGWAEYHDVKEEKEVDGLSSDEMINFFSDVGSSKGKGWAGFVNDRFRYLTDVLKGVTGLRADPATRVLRPGEWCPRQSWPGISG